MDNLAGLSFRDWLAHVCIRNKDGADGNPTETPWKPSATQKRLMEMFAKIPHKPSRLIMLKTTPCWECSPLFAELWRKLHEPRQTDAQKDN